MRVTGTAAAARIVERAKRDRRGALVFTIGTGCCESTAPFLYEDYWPGPDSEPVGEVGGVTVFAPEFLRAFEGRGRFVRLREGQNDPLELSVITRSRA